MAADFSKKSFGCGVGLRTDHFPVITNEWPEMDWFEAISENFMDSGGRPLKILEQVRGRYPVALHGTSLSIGSSDPLRPHYLKRLKDLVDRVQPFIVSDHLCWSSIEGEELHDLLPLPFTEEALKHVVSRVQKVQDHLGRQILLENVSTYVTFKHSAMPEWEFLSEVAKRSGCGILLDLNNVYVNAFNHKFDAKQYLQNIPAEKVGQFHLAGHTDMGKFLFDTHTGHVIDEIWALYREALKLYGPVSTLIEWDADIPEFQILSDEASRARKIYTEILSGPVLEHPAGARRVSPRPQEPCFEPPEKISSKSGTGPAKDFAVPEPGLPSLAVSDIQKRFKTWIQPEKQKLELPLNEQGGDPGAERLSVYSEGYTARIHESLSEAYEGVKKVIGASKFWDMSCAYAVRYPSQHYNLNHAAKHLPEFLKTWPHAKEWPFLPDLAELEWKIACSFHAFEENPFQLSELAGMALEDWEKVKIVFQPSVQQVSSKWPVLDIWRARSKPVEEITIDLEDRPQNVLIFRHGVDVHTHLMEPLENAFFIEMKKGTPLGKACEKIDLPEEQALSIQNWFQFWASAGLIVRCEFKKKTVRA